MRKAVGIIILLAGQLTIAFWSAWAQGGKRVKTYEQVMLQVRTVRATKDVNRGGSGRAHSKRASRVALESLQPRSGEMPRNLRSLSALSQRRQNAGVRDRGPDIDVQLIDLRHKLEQLPYRQYRLLSTQQFEVPLDRKHEIRLSGGEALKVRLLYCNRDKVGMWLRWEDRAGQELLDTRMHFNPDEAMVTGTDIGPDTGSILAVRVVPKR